MASVGMTACQGQHKLSLHPCSSSIGFHVLDEVMSSTLAAMQDDHLRISDTLLEFPFVRFFVTTVYLREFWGWLVTQGIAAGLAVTSNFQNQAKKQQWVVASWLQTATYNMTAHPSMISQLLIGLKLPSILPQNCHSLFVFFSVFSASQWEHCSLFVAASAPSSLNCSVSVSNWFGSVGQAINLVLSRRCCANLCFIGFQLCDSSGVQCSMFRASSCLCSVLPVQILLSYQTCSASDHQPLSKPLSRPDSALDVTLNLSGMRTFCQTTSSSARMHDELVILASCVHHDTTSIYISQFCLCMCVVCINSYVPYRSEVFPLKNIFCSTWSRYTAAACSPFSRVNLVLYQRKGESLIVAR